MTAAAAADQLDRILSDILLRIRDGRCATLPGLGTFRPNRKDGLQFDVNLAEGFKTGKSGKEKR